MPTTALGGPLAEWAPDLREARLRVDEIEPQVGARVRLRRVRDVTRRGHRTVPHHRRDPLTVAEGRAAVLAPEGYAA